jgi:hypothetical protein
LATILIEQGYEAQTSEVAAPLYNWPLHLLAEHQSALPCGLNLDLLNRLAKGADPSDIVPADLTPNLVCAASDCGRLPRPHPQRGLPLPGSFYPGDLSGRSVRPSAPDPDLPRPVR